MVKIQSDIEKKFGIIVLDDFRSIVKRIIETKITHLNFQTDWTK
jgi:hypothetical protein